MNAILRKCRFILAMIVLLASATVCCAQEYYRSWAQMAKDGKPKSDDRTYLGPGNWFVGLDVGTGLSLAENTAHNNFYKTRLPSGTLQIGRTLTPKWSLRLTAGISSQLGHPSAGAIRYLSDMFSPYQFSLGVGTFDVMLNLANVFRKYNSRNWYDGYLVVGGGALYRFYVDDKVDDWYEDIYVVDRTKEWYWTAKVGYEAAFHILRACDLTFELDFHATDNAYNGVKGGTQPMDFFVTAKLGIVYYIPNRAHRQRFANPKIYHRYWTNLN